MKEVKNTIQTEPREPPIFFYVQKHQFQRSLASESSFLPWIKSCFQFPEQDFADSDKFGHKFRCQPKLQKTQNFGSRIFFQVRKYQGLSYQKSIRVWEIETHFTVRPNSSARFTTLSEISIYILFSL